GAEPQLSFHGQALMIWAWDAPSLVGFDPGYFEDFWSVPGYAGADGLLARDVVEEKTTVTATFSATQLAALDGPSMGAGKMGATFCFTSGAAAGRQVYCTGAVGDALLSSVVSGPIFDGVLPGDEIVVDNREFLAFCHYDRHQVRPGNLATLQFTVDGRPMYP